MTKKIAVVVRDRQGEALRMALGLILLDDLVDVYVLDHTLALPDQEAAHVGVMRDMGMAFYSNDPANRDMQCLPTEEIAHRLLEYDHVLPY